jgi:hypothetical protein
MALLLLAFALLLAEAGRPGCRVAVPLGVIATGVTYVYSFPGLAWLAGVALVWGAFELVKARRSTSSSRPAGISRRGALIGVGVALAALVLLMLPELGRFADFVDFRALHPDRANEGGLGNLPGQLSPLEALGIWPTSEFRLSAADSSLPAALFYALAAGAAAALALGLTRWIRRHGTAVPAALGAAVAIYVGARVFGTVYTSAKALMIASPLIVLTALGGLLDRDETPAEAPRRKVAPLRLLALALMAGAALSSLLVLRQAPVGPENHMRQLDELRPLVEGHRVLFLGRDNFVLYELRGSRPYTAVRNYYDPFYVRPNLELKDVFAKFDFDSVKARDLEGFRYVITTRAAYASGPPPGYGVVRRTDDYALWKRGGRVGDRRTLAEGAQPGAPLDCGSGEGGRLAREGGTASVFGRAPAIGAAGEWSPAATIENGATATQALRLSAGTWEISLQYDATQELSVAGPGLDATLPANLDYRGSLPYFPVGTVRVDRSGPVALSVSVERPPLAGRLLHADSIAHLGAIAATQAGDGGPLPGEGERTVPLARACGGYVDWYEPTRGR